MNSNRNNRNNKKFINRCNTCLNPCIDKKHCNKLGYDYKGNEVHVCGAYLLLTENCNLRCKYCFEGNSRNIKKIMSKEIAYKTVDYLFEEACLSSDKIISITFFGGEPMLNPKLAKEIIIYTEEKIKDTDIKSHYSLITNGTVYNDDVEDFLNTWHKYKGNEVHVQLSYDGIPEIQSAGRPCADPNIKSSDLVEEVSKKYIDYYKRNNISINHIDIHSVITKKSMNNIYESYLYFVEKLGIPFSHFAWLMEENWDDNDVEIFDKQLEKIVNYLIKVTGDTTRFPLKSFDNCSGCASGKGLMCVDCEGNVYPCHRFFFYDENRRPNYLLGNINNEHDKVIDLERVDRFRKFNPAECYDEACQMCIACNEYYTGELAVMPNEYQIKFVKVINKHKERFVSILERRTLFNKINNLTDANRRLNNINNSLNQRVTNLENIIFNLVNNNKENKNTEN